MRNSTEYYTITHNDPEVRLIISIDAGTASRVLDFKGKIDGLEYKTTIRDYPAMLISWWQGNDLVLHTIREEPLFGPEKINIKRVLTLSADTKMITESRTTSHSDGTQNTVANILDRQ